MTNDLSPHHMQRALSRLQKLGLNPKRLGKVALPANLACLSILVLDLSVRSRNALFANGTNSVGQLVSLTDIDLLKLRNFGRKSLTDVHEAIDKFLAAHTTDLDLSEQSPDEEPAELGKTEASTHSSGGWQIPNESNVETAVTSGAPVEVLDLSTRPSNALKRLHIDSVGKLLAYSKQQMKVAENIGSKSLQEMESKVFAYLSGNGVGGNESPSPSLGTRAYLDELLRFLPERQRNIIKDRYGLWDGIAETLQDIGDKLGLTRERIRQIEDKGLKRLRRVYGPGPIKNFVLTKIAAYLSTRADSTQGIVSDDEIAGAFADDCTAEEAALAIGLLRDVNASLFARQMVEAEWGVYCLDKTLAAEYKVLLEILEGALERYQKPLSEAGLYQSLSRDSGRAFSREQMRLLQRLLAVSPSVVRLQNGTIVLSKWTEFRRRDLTNVAEAALRLLGRPAHFRELTLKIGTLLPATGDINEKSLHMALVCGRDKFVWVKNGTYGLKAWGLTRPPYIKDRLVELLSESSYPLPYWHLKERVLEVCNCKETSVRMTLDLNATIFKKFESDQYGLRKHFEGNR